jgi:(R,R)-butanediol dehydrogenase/meso-butanediol dehydrogenase/diacetyl reductase
MRAVVFHRPGEITCEEVPDPTIGSDGVIVRVTRCGLCGGDVSMTSGGAVDFPPGWLMGHECAGEVVEIGRDVTRVKVGDRVACMPMASCGQCAMCLQGRGFACAQVRPQYGGFSDYVGTAESALVVAPASLTDADAALVEPIACGLRALRQAGMRGGERILVIGAGAMAIAIVFWARQLKAGRIVVVSRSAYRAEAVHAMGADAVLAFDEEDPGAVERALGGPPDIVAECVGKPGMLAKAVGHAAIGATVISMGMCGQPDHVIPGVCTFKEVKLVFPLAYSPEEYEATVRAFDALSFRPDLMVSDVISLDAVPGTIEDLRQGRKKSLKIQVDPRLGRTR